MTALDLVHKAVIERAHDILRPYFAAMAEGDWRASEALLNRVYGKPESKQDPTPATGVQELLKLSPQELHALRTHALAIIAESTAREQTVIDQSGVLPEGKGIAEDQTAEGEEEGK